LNLQLQRQLCKKAGAFLMEMKNFVFNTHWDARGFVKFYNAGVVTSERRLGSSLKPKTWMS
jgi:hypothetical protein